MQMVFKYIGTYSYMAIAHVPSKTWAKIDMMTFQRVFIDYHLLR